MAKPTKVGPYSLIEAAGFCVRLDAEYSHNALTRAESELLVEKLQEFIKLYDSNRAAHKIQSSIDTMEAQLRTANKQVVDLSREIAALRMQLRDIQEPKETKEVT